MSTAQTTEAPKTEAPALKAVQAPKKMIGFESVPIADITVEIGYVDNEGKRREVLHEINSEDVRITSCDHGIHEKTKITKDDEGHILGIEPTGEYELVLKVKFFRSP